MSEPPSCWNCKHLKPTVDGLFCEAFGGPVPFAIASGQIDHTKPVPGDNGIVWEPIDEVGEY